MSLSSAAFHFKFPHEKKKGYIFFLQTGTKATLLEIIQFLWQTGGPGTVAGIATGYGLDGSEIESRWGARFSAPVQTGPGVHPASCTMVTGSFLGVKGGRGMMLTPHPLLVPWS